MVSDPFGRPTPGGCDSTSTPLLHPLPYLPLGKPHAYPYTRFSRKTRQWRLPVALRDNKLHGLEPLLPLCIVAVAHTDETVPILRKQLLRAFNALQSLALALPCASQALSHVLSFP